MRYPIKALCVLLLVFIAAVFGGCDAERETPTIPQETPRNIQVKDDVLMILELSYNERDIDEYKRLLDDDFIFFFSEADYSQGDIPVSWERPDEITTNRNLFNPNFQGPLRATNIDLTLTYTQGEWTEVPQQDEDSWYSKEVEYNITVQTVSGVDYKGNRLKAQFIIRQAIPDGETEKIWRIIRWRDLGDGTRTSSNPSSNLVEETTWGGIKALYQE